MDICFPRCAGLDVHKKTVVACRIWRDSNDKRMSDKRTFGTMTADLLMLGDWLAERQCTHVAIESTGVYWRPIFNILEADFEVWVVNANHFHNVPGNKTDSRDAAWLAECMEHGLLRPSFVPEAPQRDLRELTRARLNFVRERVNLVNRVQKLLEGANIKLACVASNVMGVSGHEILSALVDGQDDVSALAGLARGQLRKKAHELERALNGRVRPVHRIVLSEHLIQIDSIDETIRRLEAAIDEYISPFKDAVAVLETIPGVSKRIAQTLVAEIGADMSRFPSARHLCAWGGVAPANNQSGGRRKPGGRRMGNQVVCCTLTQAANVAVRLNGYHKALYYRLAARRGKAKAIIAVANSMLEAIYYMIQRNQSYKDLGNSCPSTRAKETAAKTMIAKLTRLGYQVVADPEHQPIAA